MAQELAFQDEAFAAKFLEKALAAGVRFTPEQVLEMAGAVDQALLGRLAEQTDVPFDREQLEEIWGLIDDHAFRRISRRTGIDVLDEVNSTRHAVPTPPRKKGDGLFSFLVGSALDDWLHRRDRDER